MAEHSPQYNRQPYVQNYVYGKTYYKGYEQLSYTSTNRYYYPGQIGMTRFNGVYQALTIRYWFQTDEYGATKITWNSDYCEVSDVWDNYSTEQRKYESHGYAYFVWRLVKVSEYSDDMLEEILDPDNSIGKYSIGHTTNVSFNGTAENIKLDPNTAYYLLINPMTQFKYFSPSSVNEMIYKIGNILHVTLEGEYGKSSLVVATSGTVGDKAILRVHSTHPDYKHIIELDYGKAPSEIPQYDYPGDTTDTPPNYDTIVQQGYSTKGAYMDVYRRPTIAYNVPSNGTIEWNISQDVYKIIYTNSPNAPVENPNSVRDQGNPYYQCYLRLLTFTSEKEFVGLQYYDINCYVNKDHVPEGKIWIDFNEQAYSGNKDVVLNLSDVKVTCIGKNTTTLAPITKITLKIGTDTIVKTGSDISSQASKTETQTTQIPNPDYDPSDETSPIMITTTTTTTYSGYGFSNLLVEDIKAAVFYVTFTDANGLSYSTSKALSNVPYVNPTIELNYTKSLAVDSEVAFSVSASGNVYVGKIGKQSSSSSVMSDNTCEVAFRFKQADATNFGSWNTFVVTKSDNRYNTSTLKINGLDYKKKYIIEGYVKDSVQTVYSKQYSITFLPVYDWSDSDFRVNVSFRLSDVSYGTELPSYAQEGEVFFKI